MTELLNFAGEHPWLTFFLALIAAKVSEWTYRDGVTCANKRSSRTLQDRGQV